MLNSFLTTHAIGDIGLYVCFLLGQLLFILKRAASAIRNPANPVKSRRQFIFVNWDVLSVRAAIEAILFYYPWRHIALATILGWFHIDASSGWIAAIVQGGEAGGPIAAIAIGYWADSGLDGLAQRNNIPDWAKRWLKENIPSAPNSVAHIP